MFSGIITTVGTIHRKISHAHDLTVAIEAPSSFLTGVRAGESMAVNGVCLTLIELTDRVFWVDISAETLSLTYFSGLQVGDPVNLEKALTLQTALNGHLVMGHVDGAGVVQSKEMRGRSWVFEMALPENLMCYMAQKGSVCLDGISLTVNNLTGHGIAVNCIPQTLMQTTAQYWKIGQAIHIEVDMIARYLKQLVSRDC